MYPPPLLCSYCIRSPLIPSLFTLALPYPLFLHSSPLAPRPPAHHLVLGARSTSAVKPKGPLSRSLHGVDVEGPGCGAHAFLSPTHKVQGFHLACVEQQPGGGGVSVTLFPHGQGAGNQTLTVQMTGEEEGGLESARAILFVRQSRERHRACCFSCFFAGGSWNWLLPVCLSVCRFSGLPSRWPLVLLLLFDNGLGFGCILRNNVHGVAAGGDSKLSQCFPLKYDPKV